MPVFCGDMLIFKFKSADYKKKKSNQRSDSETFEGNLWVLNAARWHSESRFICMTCCKKTESFFFFFFACVFVLNCELFSRRQTGDSSCVHSYSSLFLCGRSVSVFSVTTHWDLKSPDGDSRDSTQHTSWLHFLLKPITLFQFTDALSDLSELFCCFWNLLVLFFRAVYEDDDDDDDDWRCILGLCVFCPNKSFWKHQRVRIS